MATHDYVLDDASGAAFRSDLNNCLDAIVTQNVTTDGNAPATVKDWMIWTDKQGGYRKIYNADTSSWVNIAKLDGGAEFSGDVQFKDASSVQVQWDSSESTLEFGGFTSGGVETALTFGANFAHKVAFFHDNDTRIYANVGSVVTNLITAGTDFRIHSGASTNANYLAKFSRGGGATLYWDGTSGAGKKFETTATGVAVDGLITANTMTLASNLSIAGALQYTTAGNKTLDVPTLAGSQTFELRHQDGSTYENALKATANAGVELYNNGHKMFDTFATGARVFGTEGAEAHLEILADEGDDNADRWRFVVNTAGIFHFQNYASGAWQTNAIANAGGNVSLWHNNSSKLATTSAGVEVTGITHSTTGYTWGTAPHYLYSTSATEANLRIGTTSGSHLYARFAFDPVAGDFEIGNASGNVLLTVGDQTPREKAIRCINNGSVELYNNGVLEAYTKTTGMVVNRNFDVSISEANATGDCFLQIGSSPDNITVGDHNAFIDLISTNSTSYSSPDYDLRIIRYPGSNGSAAIKHKGTGTLTLEANQGKIDFAGYSFATASAWVRFHGGAAGTSPHNFAPANSYKVSSVTDNGTGDYSVNFTAALVGNNLSATNDVCAVFDANGPVVTNHEHCVGFIVSTSSTSVRVFFINVDNSDRRADPSIVCGIFFS